MRRVLYYPHMNLPYDCESLSTSIIFSNQLNIIAPIDAKIDDHFTQHLIREGVVTKIDPSRTLDDEEFQAISKRLERFIKERESIQDRLARFKKNKKTPFSNQVDIRRDQDWLIHREKLVHHDKLIHQDKMVHFNKFTPRQNPIRERKIHQDKLIHKGKARDIIGLLLDKNLAKKVSGGFYQVDGEISSFLLGAVSKELSLKYRLDVVTSNFGLNEQNYEQDIVSLFLQDISLDLLPSVKIKEPLKEIDALIRIRNDHRDQLDEYVRNLMIDINSYTKFALDQYYLSESEETKLALRDYIMARKTDIVRKYSYEYKDLEKILRYSRSKQIRSRVVSAIPICLSIALAETNPYASTFLGAMSGLSYFKNFEKPSLRLEKHKVIYNIKQSMR